MTTHALGTVKREATAGAYVTVVLPDGHEMQTDGQGVPVYAGEDLRAGQRVMWAPWLTGLAVVSVDTERELPQVNADLAAANAKLAAIAELLDLTDDTSPTMLIRRSIRLILDKP